MSTPIRTLNRRNWFIPSLFGLALAAHAWIASIGWESFGGHEFRQAQTAITAYWMNREGFRLDYSTPVLGKPWSVPMEFPAYQWMVAKLSTLINMPVTQAGRWVSLVAFYLTIPALILFLRGFNVPRDKAFLAVLPVLASPVYLFFSREVLIESTAVMAGAWFVGGGWRFVDSGRLAWLPVALLAGALAALVKVTTWGVFLAPIAFATVWSWWSARPDWKARLISTGLRLAIVLTPLFAIAWWWVRTADQIKSQNPIAAFLISGNLTEFNFGTLGMRFTTDFWKRLSDYWTAGLLPGWCIGATLAAAVAISPRWRGLAAAAFAAFLSGPLVFANLYYLHDYYWYANGLFLCLAAGLVACGLLDRPNRRRLGWALLALTIFGQGYAWRSNFYDRQAFIFPEGTALSLAIKHLTDPEAVVVVHGSDWHSGIALQSERRAIMVPDWVGNLYPETLRHSFELLEDKPVQLVAFTGTSRERSDWIDQRIQELDLYPEPLFTEVAGAKVYAARRVYEKFLYRLNNEDFVGLNVSGTSAIEASNEIQPLGEERFGALLEDFSPTPDRGVLPFGLSMLNTGERLIFMAHTPTDLYFAIPPGAESLEAIYSVYEGAYDKPAFDGVEFRFELHHNNGSIDVLHKHWLQPHLHEGDRGPQSASLPLPEDVTGELVLRTHPGPDNNGAYDWALWERVVIE